LDAARFILWLSHLIITERLMLPNHLDCRRELLAHLLIGSGHDADARIVD
jgi:hypothetical protein